MTPFAKQSSKTSPATPSPNVSACERSDLKQCCERPRSWRICDNLFSVCTDDNRHISLHQIADKMAVGEPFWERRCRCRHCFGQHPCGFYYCKSNVLTLFQVFGMVYSIVDLMEVPAGLGRKSESLTAKGSLSVRKVSEFRSSCLHICSQSTDYLRQ